MPGAFAAIVGAAAVLVAAWLARTPVSQTGAAVAAPFRLQIGGLRRRRHLLLLSLSVLSLWFGSVSSLVLSLVLLLAVLSWS